MLVPLLVGMAMRGLADLWGGWHVGCMSLLGAHHGHWPAAYWHVWLYMDGISLHVLCAWCVTTCVCLMCGDTRVCLVCGMCLACCVSFAHAWQMVVCAWRALAHLLLSDSPSQASPVPVAIEALDVNDNAPQLAPDYEPFVCASTAPGQVCPRG